MSLASSSQVSYAKSSSERHFEFADELDSPVGIARREYGSLGFLQSLRFSRFQFGLAMPCSFNRVCSSFKLRSIDEVSPALMAI